MECYCFAFSFFDTWWGLLQVANLVHTLVTKHPGRIFGGVDGGGGGGEGAAGPGLEASLRASAARLESFMAKSVDAAIARAVQTRGRK